MPDAAGAFAVPEPAPRGRLELVRCLLAPGALRAAFQPIVRLVDESVIGYEALVRVDDPDCAGPEELLNPRARSASAPRRSSRAGRPSPPLESLRNASSYS